MNPYIDQLKKHLTKQPPVCLSDDCESLLDVLYYAYIEYCTTDSPQVKECLEHLDTCTRHLPFKEQDKILTAALSLSAAQDRQAFLEGIRTGASLIFALQEQ